MDTPHIDKIWIYRNFNMGTELDIAGEFIYDGIHTLNQINTVNEEAQLFSFLYHTAVGIERLQKIIIVLFEVIHWEEKDAFEESLKTHSHMSLNNRIKKATNIQLNSRENAFLQMLNNFYQSARYDRFNLISTSTKERELFCDYLNKQIPKEKIEKHIFTNHIRVTPYVKEIIGRVIGSLSKKYFKLVHEGCNKTGTFTYELRPGSKAEKVFLSTYNNNSLQIQIKTEGIALKELLVFLRNTKEKHPLLHYMENIKPLDFDIALLNEYINELSKGTVPQSLIDEIDTLYEENHYFNNREEEINAIGNTSVDFDFYPIHQCYLLMDNLLKENLNCVEFANKFIDVLDLIDEDYGFDKLNGASDICHLFLKQEINSEVFCDKIKSYFSKLKKAFNY